MGPGVGSGLGPGVGPGVGLKVGPGVGPGVGPRVDLRVGPGGGSRGGSRGRSRHGSGAGPGWVQGCVQGRVQGWGAGCVVIRLGRGPDMNLPQIQGEVFKWVDGYQRRVDSLGVTPVQCGHKVFFGSRALLAFLSTRYSRALHWCSRLLSWQTLPILGAFLSSHGSVWHEPHKLLCGGRDVAGMGY